MTTKRDEVMARLAAADVSLRDARSAIELVLTFFCDPTDDQDGSARSDEIESAFMSCHLAAICMSKAQAAFKEMDEEDLVTEEDDSDEEGMEEGDDEAEEAGEA